MARDGKKGQVRDSQELNKAEAWKMKKGMNEESFEESGKEMKALREKRDLRMPFLSQNLLVIQVLDGS